MNSRRRFILAVLVAIGGLLVADTVEARHWRRGWPGHYGWGYPAWTFPPGGYYGPSNVWYVPVEPERPIVLPRTRCASGRVPARWVKVTTNDGREIWRHVMSRCR